jgi:hypothetical protein
MEGPPIGFALALPSNSKTQLERVSKGNPSSLLGLVISDKEKHFITLTPGGYHRPPRTRSSGSWLSGWARAWCWPAGWT